MIRSPVIFALSVSLSLMLATAPPAGAQNAAPAGVLPTDRTVPGATVPA
jgi:hypothetical protein